MLKLVSWLCQHKRSIDRNVVDGTIKTIESTSQKLSTQVRRLTTGSARDYIMMAALGVLVIYLLLEVMILNVDYLSMMVILPILASIFPLILTSRLNPAAACKV